MKITYRTITKDSARGLCSCDSTALIEDHSKRACRASHESHSKGRRFTLVVFLSQQGQEQSYEMVRTSELDEDEEGAMEAYRDNFLESGTQSY